MFIPSRSLRWVPLLLLAARALAAEAPAPQQATLLLRILAFDRKLPTRASGAVTIAVIYREGNARSESAMSQIATALEEAGRKNTVAGLPVKIARLPFTTHLDADLEREGVTAAYLCSGLDDVVNTISQATKTRRALTFSSHEDYLKSGASLALVARDTKLSIVVHLANARGEGADLDSNLLRIAEVIR